MRIRSTARPISSVSSSAAVSRAHGSRCTDAAAKTAPIQGLLEFLRIPYTGSGVKGSAIGMDKLRTKQLLAGAGLATPDYRVLNGPEDFAGTIDALGLPLMIKPAEEGSSIGLTRVERADDLAAAFAAASEYRCDVFAEALGARP